MSGILIQKSGNYWVANANSHWSVIAPTAHAVVEMLKSLAAEEPLDYSK